MSYVGGHEKEEDLEQADLPSALPERHHDQFKADTAENALGYLSTDGVKDYALADECKSGHDAQHG